MYKTGRETRVMSISTPRLSMTLVHLDEIKTRLIDKIDVRIIQNYSEKKKHYERFSSYPSILTNPRSVYQTV